MSYNINNFKIKEIKNLSIPLCEFFTHKRADFHPEKEIDEKGNITLSFGGPEIKGKLKDGNVFIEKIELYGEFSGTAYNDIFLPALKKSTGRLEAIVIWEGDGEVYRLISDNGIVTDTEIDL